MRRFDVLDPTTPLLGHYLLEASAGTGKTFAIEHITARLIEEQNYELNEILIVTFTRAATRELKIRIQNTLKNRKPSLKIQKALALIDQAQIFTIHGFCHRMLMEFAFEANLDCAPLSEKEPDYRCLLKEYITDVFRTFLSKEEYSTSQLFALGQNKEALTQKVLSLVEKEGEFPSYDSFSTSHQKYNQIRKTTHFPAHLLNEFSKIKDKKGFLKPPFKKQVALLEKPFLTPEEFEVLTAQPSILSLLKESNQYKKSKADASPLFDFANSLRPVIERAASPLCTLMRIARTARTYAQQEMEKKDIFTPDDILKKMQDCLSKPFFRDKVRSRYKGAIIDEFQDTDPIQWNIFKTLFIDDPASALYLVGDPKQSIYSFRSADIHTYFSVEKTIPQKACLDTNYRSDPALVQSLNAFFSSNPQFLSLPDVPIPFQPVKSAKNPNRPFPDDKSPVHFFVYETEKKREKSWPSSEIEQSTFFPFIASEILKLTEHDFQYSDFAVLVKDRFQAARLKMYLEMHHIPTQAKNVEPLTLTPTFSIVRSLLEALINPCEIAVKRFLSHIYSRKALIDTDFLTQTIAAFAKPQSLQEALRDLYTPTDLDAYSDYIKLCELLLDYQTQTKSTLPKVLEFLLSLNEVNRCSLFDPNSVTIMTIHMSKGLEFGVVFALGLVNRYTGQEDFIRHKKSWLLFNPEDPICQNAVKKQEAEKLRQLYVALTRAKHRVYIPLLRDKKRAPIPLGQASPIELFDPVPTDATYLYPQTLLVKKPAAPTLIAPIPCKKSYSPRYLHSYSSLAKTAPQPSVKGSATLPKGAETGRIIHSLLETILKNPSIDIPTLLEEKLPPDFPYQPTFDLLKNALNAPLSPYSFTLSEVTSLYPEVEFFYPDPPNFIKGYIDLIFFHDGRYFLLDWKTNFLPSYDVDALHLAMNHHDYYLQARLYHTALSRYLRGAPIAGSYYIFLRGLPDEGVFFLPSDQDLIT